MRNKIPLAWGRWPSNNISESSSTINIFDSSLKIEWMNSRDAAAFLRISVKALRNKTSNGCIPYHKFGRLNRYKKSELEALLLSQKRGKAWA